MNNMKSDRAPGAIEPLELNVLVSKKPAVLHLQRKGRQYDVMALEMEGSRRWVLAFGKARGEVVNLDHESDAMQCWGLSTKVQVGHVVLGASEMKASSLDELKAALKSADLRAFDPEEI